MYYSHLKLCMNASIAMFTIMREAVYFPNLLDDGI